MPDRPTASLRATKLSLALTALILAALQNPALSADWGYDDMDGHATGPGGAIPTKIDKGPKSGKTAKAGRPTTVSRGAAETEGLKNDAKLASPAKNPAEPDETSLRQEEAQKPPSPAEIAARKKVENLKNWMEIYALAASSATEDDRNQVLDLATLTPDTRKKLEKITFEKLDQNVAQYTAVTPVWQSMRKKISEDIDYKESYRLLFRSLLRHALSRLEPTAPEAEAIQEVLGPARIAEIGPPVLTEDAINAYSDMTVFLYQKRHPDHTVEGDDNRQLFAEVIRQKYNDAPNPAAKKAMCNFDVTWASFRCRYLDAPPAEREKLIATIDGSAADKTSPAKNQTPARPNISLTSPKLLKIFALGPWAEDSKTSPLAVKMSQMSEPTK